MRAELVYKGGRLALYFLQGDPRCTAKQGVKDWCERQKNVNDAYQEIDKILRFIADRGLATPKAWFKQMPGRPEVYAVRKKKLRIYGFLSGDCLYLCTHDGHKKQKTADKRILDTTESLRDEWDELWEARLDPTTD